MGSFCGSATFENYLFVCDYQIWHNDRPLVLYLAPRQFSDLYVKGQGHAFFDIFLPLLGQFW